MQNISFRAIYKRNSYVLTLIYSHMFPPFSLFFRFQERWLCQKYCGIINTWYSNQWIVRFKYPRVHHCFHVRVRVIVEYCLLKYRYGITWSITSRVLKHYFWHHIFHKMNQILATFSTFSGTPFLCKSRANETNNDFLDSAHKGPFYWIYDVKNNNALKKKFTKTDVTLRC